ncbi:MAG: PEP/pyruvate-binding domain-containing protein [Pseudomonadota bacterium]
MIDRLYSLFKKKPKQHRSDHQVMNVFRMKYANFKTLLESNSELLKIITDIEEKLRGQDVFGMAYIRSQSARIIFHAARMVKSFENLSGREYPLLMKLIDNIQHTIKQELERKSEPVVLEYVLPYGRITKEMVDFVGGKNANLGEVANRADIPVPAGFAITTRAFETFLQANDLTDEIRKQMMEIAAAQPETVVRISETIQRLFLEAKVPADIEKAISEAYAELCAKSVSGRENLKIAMRSSAIGEDSEFSFAGQYVSALNVPPQRIIIEYKKILASLFTPRAISYRLHMGIPFEDIVMSVACLEMIPAKVSGVMYSRHPFNVLENTVIINAVWGLGPYVVDGTVTPDSYSVSKDSQPVLLTAKISEKRLRLTTRPDGYLMEEQVEPELRNRPCLSEDQLKTLAVYAVQMENHFQCPQDIEWAIDPGGNLFILQARPLRLEGKSSRNGEVHTQRLPGYTLLLEGGDIACPGVGFGRAHHVRSEDDLMSFPEGGVLVAAHPSPQYVIIMPKARAILTNSGSVLGHMASLAREFKVPTILNTQTVTSAVEQSAEITVDAYSGRVYLGKVPELIEIKVPRGVFMKDTPVYKTLRKTADLIVPLNLVDPKSSDFAPQNCRTIHDIMRLVHELSYTELFQISDLVTGRGKISVKLDAPIPIDLYIIDLDGGLSDDSKSLSKITADSITSVPFKALLKGMLREDLRSLEPRPIEIKGFFSVMSEQMLSPPNMAAERFGDKSYAIISDKYLNFSSRVGYHYSILDCYCGKTSTKNYINFQFKGGAADDVRKNRRARLIEKVLGEMAFLVEVQGDRVTARFAKREPEVMEEKLDYLGRLLLFTRQMDMLMRSEESITHLADCFLKGKYNFELKNNKIDSIPKR